MAPRIFLKGNQAELGETSFGLSIIAGVFEKWMN
jgi:hypothetical protein